MKYRLTPAAEADLDSTAAYIAERSPAAALKLLQDFTRRWELLATQPFCGQSRDDFAADLRSLVMGNFIAFYRVETDAIVIIRVLHGRRNITAEDVDA
jgi:toxin ParE1/3/4